MTFIIKFNSSRNGWRNFQLWQKWLHSTRKAAHSSQLERSELEQCHEEDAIFLRFGAKPKPVCSSAAALSVIHDSAQFINICLMHFNTFLISVFIHEHFCQRRSNEWTRKLRKLKTVLSANKCREFRGSMAQKLVCIERIVYSTPK